MARGDIVQLQLLSSLGLVHGFLARIRVAPDTTGIPTLPMNLESFVGFDGTWVNKPAVVCESNLSSWDPFLGL